MTASSPNLDAKVLRMRVPRTAKEIRQECARRRENDSLSVRREQVPSVLRAHVEALLDALADGALYLFPHRRAVLACKTLCSPVIRRSTVPVELQDEMVLQGGVWCPEVSIPIDHTERAERGGWWFSHLEDLERIRRLIAAGRPNDGRAASARVGDLFYLDAKYMPELALREQIPGRFRRRGPTRPAWVFRSQEALEQGLAHCRAVIPFSVFPRQPVDLWARVHTHGGVPDRQVVCLTEEIGGFYFPDPADQAEARSMLQAAEQGR